MLNANPQFKAVGDTFESLAKSEGIKFSRFDNNYDPSTSLQNARLMVQQDPDVLIDWSAAASANAAIGEQFKKTGKPCVAITVPIPGCAFYSPNSPKLGVALADAAAPLAKKKGWTAENTTVVLVWTPAAGEDINSEFKTFYSAYAKQFPTMKQLEPDQISLKTTQVGDMNALFIDGQAALQPSNKAAQQALQVIPKDRNLVVLVLNDDSGLGVLRALQQAGRSADNTMLISSTASAAGLHELRTNPMWALQGSPFFGVWPKYLLAMAKAMTAGVKPPAVTEAPSGVLTKDTVDTYYDDAGNVIKDPPVPAASDYLQKYGLSQG